MLIVYLYFGYKHQCSRRPFCKPGSCLSWVPCKPVRSLPERPRTRREEHLDSHVEKCEKEQTCKSTTESFTFTLNVLKWRNPCQILKLPCILLSLASSSVFVAFSWASGQR